MQQPAIKLVKTHPLAVLPEANNKDIGTGDTGYDLVAVEKVKIPRNGSNVVNVGLTLADITPGYWFRIEPRSGLGFKYSLQPHLGVIDNGYRGDLGVKLYNFSLESYLVSPGDKIAQLVVYPLLQTTFAFTDDITETARGDKGFGSSDAVVYHKLDEGTVEKAAFDTIDDFIAYAKQTNMPDDIFEDFLREQVWKRK